MSRFKTVSTRLPSFSALPRLLLLMLLILSTDLASAATAPRPGVDVLNARLSYSEGRWVVNADLDYRFSKPAKRALDHGVPLTLVVHLQLERQRPYWWNETLLSLSRRLNISFHPLTQSYRLVYEDTGVSENFAAYTTLLEYLGTLRDWPLVTLRQPEPSQHYTARLGVSLDIEALPLPLRLRAYINPEWHMETHPYLWHFVVD